MNLGKLGDIKNIMQQAMKMQEDMQKVQEELGNERVEHSVAGGKVVVRMNGHQDLLAVEIHPDVITPDDPQMLQDLIFTAFVGAQRKSRDLAESRMKSVAPAMPPFMGDMA